MSHVRMLAPLAVLLAALIATDPASGVTPYVFVGEWGGPGSAPGQFNGPWSLAVDDPGNVYVTDFFNHRVQKFDAVGNFLLSWGGNGPAPGQFNFPIGIAVAPAGTVFVGDLSNGRVQTFTAGGSFLSSWGAAAAGVPIFEPEGLDLDPAGNVVVSTLSQQMFRFTDGGVRISHWTTGLGIPQGIATNARSECYVTQAGNDRVLKFTTDGTPLGSWGSTGTGPGQFDEALGLTVGLSGNVYVADYHNSRVQIFDPGGVFLCEFGTPGTGLGQFQLPADVAVDHTGNVFVADVGRQRILKFVPRPIPAEVTTWSRIKALSATETR